MTDPARRDASVEALVARQFRRVDDQPLLRRQLLEELRGVAEAAAAENGRMLAISTAVAGGIPMANVRGWTPEAPRW